MKRDSDNSLILVHVASGIGNIILATPLLVVLSWSGFTIDLLVDGDYFGIADLFRDWAAIRRIYEGPGYMPDSGLYTAIVPAIPPYYWSRFRRYYLHRPNAIERPPDSLFYVDERAYYLHLAKLLGCNVDGAPMTFLPLPPSSPNSVKRTTLLLAPGCKSGEMSAKRWPHFPELADRFDDVGILGTAADLFRFGGDAMSFPIGTRSFIDKLSLRENAQLMSNAGAVVANDSGLGHLAGAVGIPTVLIFGPTSSRVLGGLPPNVIALRRGLVCEPCWFNRRFEACKGQIRCLTEISVDEVAAVVREQLSAWR